ncbi:MAG TPA: hypothetical protein VIK91_11390, partial [Nannocystis sp.]
RSTDLVPCICTSLLVLGCGESDDRGTSQASTSGPGITGITSPVTSNGTTDSGEATSTGSGSGEATSGSGASSEPLTGGGGIKFDVGDDSDPFPTDTTDGEEKGCQKIDFLFVIDNSGSMSDEQQALIASFDGFIASIENTVQAEDYHIMVIDTDAGNSAFEECEILCAFFGGTCNGYPCDMLPMPTGCDAQLGSGLVTNPQGQDCGVVGGNRYMIDGQPNLGQTFSCLANVGTDGSGTERPMEAMVTAVSTLNGPGQCNEGFVRKDALLVVTFITDEEDDEESNGNPAGWHASLVAAKYGSETSIVVLGLIGDTDQPNAICSNGEAEASPRLRQFAESFTYGSWASICSLNYAPFFDQAVSVIDTACDKFEPPG